MSATESQSTHKPHWRDVEAVVEEHPRTLGENALLFAGLGCAAMAVMLVGVVAMYAVTETEPSEAVLWVGVLVLFGLGWLATRGTRYWVLGRVAREQPGPKVVALVRPHVVRAGFPPPAPSAPVAWTGLTRSVTVVLRPDGGERTVVRLRWTGKDEPPTVTKVPVKGA